MIEYDLLLLFWPLSIIFYKNLRIMGTLNESHIPKDNY